MNASTFTVYGLKCPEGVRIFRDVEMNRHFCTFNHANHSRIPDHRWRYVTLNCFRWNLQWIN